MATRRRETTKPTRAREAARRREAVKRRDLPIAENIRLYQQQMSAMKATWGDGPWQAEPDREAWVHSVYGLPCLIARSPMGAWCGYVGIPPQHPLHRNDDENESLLEVHGGLTYQSFGRRGAIGFEHELMPIDGVGGEEVWLWVGFDCGHYRDILPASRFPPDPGVDTYRDLAYVRSEVDSLATQIAKAGWCMVHEDCRRTPALGWACRAEHPVEED